MVRLMTSPGRSQRSLGERSVGVSYRRTGGLCSSQPLDSQGIGGSLLFPPDDRSSPQWVDPTSVGQTLSPTQHLSGTSRPSLRFSHRARDMEESPLRPPTWSPLPPTQFQRIDPFLRILLILGGIHSNPGPSMTPSLMALDFIVRFIRVTVSHCHRHRILLGRFNGDDFTCCT